MHHVLVKVVAMDNRIFVVHSHCNLDKEELLAHKVEAIHIPDTMDNLHLAEGNLHMEQVVDNTAFEVENLEAEMQGNVDMVYVQDEREAHPRGARQGHQIHVHDRPFGDPHVNLEQHRWQDVAASQWEYQPLAAF